MRVDVADYQALDAESRAEVDRWLDEHVPDLYVFAAELASEGAVVLEALEKTDADRDLEVLEDGFVIWPRFERAIPPPPFPPSAWHE